MPEQLEDEVTIDSITEEDQEKLFWGGLSRAGSGTCRDYDVCEAPRGDELMHTHLRGAWGKSPEYPLRALEMLSESRFFS